MRIAVVLAVAALLSGGGAPAPSPESVYWTCDGERRTLYGHAVYQAVRHGLPPRLLAGIADRESDWNPRATNPDSGAQGLVQIHPGYWPDMDGPAYDPCRALHWAAHYLQDLLNRYGTWDRVLAAYSGGVQGYADDVLVYAGREPVG